MKRYGKAYDPVMVANQVRKSIKRNENILFEMQKSLAVLTSLTGKTSRQSEGSSKVLLSKASKALGAANAQLGNSLDKLRTAKSILNQID